MIIMHTQNNHQFRINLKDSEVPAVMDALVYVEKGILREYGNKPRRNVQYLLLNSIIKELCMTYCNDKRHHINLNLIQMDYLYQALQEYRDKQTGNLTYHHIRTLSRIQRVLTPHLKDNQTIISFFKKLSAVDQRHMIESVNAEYERGEYNAPDTSLCMADN